MATSVVLLIICAVSLPILVTGKCTSNPCQNGGVCESMYKGKGYRCICPKSDVLIYTANCEIANIGFHGSEDGKHVRSALRPTINFHRHPSQLTVSFEFIGRCHSVAETQCHILSLTSPNDKPLLTVWMNKSDGNQNKYRWIIELARAKNVTIPPLTGSISADKWMKMSINVYENRIYADILSLYPKEDDELLISRQDLPSVHKFKADFKNAALMLGGFYGCLRFVYIDEAFVDLGQFTLHRNSVAINKSDYKNYASNFCYPTAKSCHSNTSQLSERIFDSNSRTKCGPNSKCDGILDSEMQCNCRCDIGTRSQLETLINSDRCWRNLTEHNGCVDDQTTITTGQSDYQLKWEASDSNCLNISAHAFSIEFMVLTSQANVASMLELNNLFSIKMVNGYLKLCFSGHKTCFDFMSVLVSDDFWHVVSVVKRNSQLLLKIDSMINKTYVPNNIKLDLICNCKIALPKSCIRGLRISDVSMPVRETDRVIDYSGKPILFHKGGGVSVGDHCNFGDTDLTPPSCNPTCQDNEECDSPVFGEPRCFCKKSFVKNGSICVKINNNIPIIINRNKLSENDNSSCDILKANWMVMIAAVLTLLAYSACGLLV